MKLLTSTLFAFLFTIMFTFASFAGWTKATSDIHNRNTFYLDFEKIKNNKQGIQTQSALYKNAKEKEVSEFKNNKIHGHGTLTFSQPHKETGLKYVGGLSGNKYNGQGTLMFN
jgi:hypothetical protein